jgi:RNA polymerase sigma factor (sigma-70 family)
MQHLNISVVFIYESMRSKDEFNFDFQNELIKKCLKNDRKAQLSLYNQYAKAMYNICLNMVHDVELAEDLMQESFISAFKKLDTFRADVSFGAWLKKITIHKCLDYLKKKKIIFEPLDESEFIVDLSETDEHYFTQRTLSEINQHIEKLPVGYRTILKLHLLEGFDHDEISQILDISSSTSRSQYSRAKSLLLKNLKKNS